MSENQTKQEPKAKASKPKRNMYRVYKLRDALVEFIDTFPEDGMSAADVAELRVQKNRIRTLFQMEGD